MDKPGISDDNQGEEEEKTEENTSEASLCAGVGNGLRSARITPCHHLLGVGRVDHGGGRQRRGSVQRQR